MESHNEQCGYNDDIFITEPPEYLRCVVCSLILRDPVQILTCGHLFCSVCFTQYSDSRTTEELLCPVDRDVVDPSKVHEDVAMQRIIGNLRVRCGEHEMGCEWNGDLRGLGKHNETCVLVLQKQQLQFCPGGSNLETEKLISELTDRVLSCEVSLADKDQKVVERDKEIIYLKHEIRTMKESFAVLSDSVSAMKKENADILQLLAGFNVFNKTVNARFNEKDEEIAELKHLLRGAELTILSLGSHISKCVDTKISEVEPQEVLNSEADILEVATPGPEPPVAATFACELESWELKTAYTEPEELRISEAKPLDNTFSTPKVDPLIVKLHRGKVGDITFSMPGNYRIQFKKWATASLPDILIKNGMKVWYEVEFVELSDPKILSRCQIGWAAGNFNEVRYHTNKGVGNVWRSYARDPIYPVDYVYNEGLRQIRDDLFSKRRSSIWNAEGGRKCVGVALDKVLGKLNYSINGLWGCSPDEMLSKESIPNDQFFAAITGENVTVEINVGDRPFAYGPPDDSYKSLLEINRSIDQ